MVSNTGGMICSLALDSVAISEPRQINAHKHCRRMRLTLNKVYGRVCQSHQRFQWHSAGFLTNRPQASFVTVEYLHP